MHILVTNDDGVTAPGLLALVKELRKLDPDATVLAPDQNWSACGHVKTMHRPMRVSETMLADGTKAWKSDGAPSDCVALGMMGAVSEKFDLVVSGINPNANIGIDVTYSGTVTAAMEAVIQGVPGFAVSLDAPEFHQGYLDFAPAASITRRIIAAFIKQGFDSHKPPIISINVPYLKEDEFKGVRITRQGTRIYQDALVNRLDPRGRHYYWIGGDVPSGKHEEGTDYGALKDGFVSVTPLTLDMTDYQAQKALSVLDMDLSSI